MGETDLLRAAGAGGGVVRRSIWDVERLASLEEVVEEAKARGFHVVETGDQLVILCHTGALHIHC